MLKLIRAEGWRVPIIVIASAADATMREHASRFGAVIVGRPPDMDDLRTIVAHLLRRPGRL